MGEGGGGGGGGPGRRISKNNMTLGNKIEHLDTGMRN